MTVSGVFTRARARRAGSGSRPWHRAIVSASVALTLGVMAACDTSSQRADVPSAADVAVVAGANSRHVVLSVKGMFCTSCEGTVTAMLRRTPGVVHATVSVERGEAAVTYDSARTSPAKLVTVITNLGYTASVQGT